MNERFDAESRVAFLSPEAPYPLTGGGQMRTASLLEYFAKRYRVHLITFAEDGSANPECALPKGLVDQITTVRLPYHRRDPVTRLARNAGRLLQGRLPLMDRFTQQQSVRRVDQASGDQRYEIAIIEHFWCAQYLSVLRAKAKRVVLDLHNLESAWHASCAASKPWLDRVGHRVFERRARRLERRLLGQFDLVLVTSDADERRVREISPEAKVAVYPNAIPLRDAPLAAEQHEIAFSGNLEYHPNVTAIKYFLSEVWPKLRQLDPQLKWRIIGKNEGQIRALVQNQPDIEVTGPIDDALAELARAKIVVVPLSAGSGTRVKIMEAWAAARPVVSSPIGAEGLPARDLENVLLAQDPSQWVDRIRELLETVNLRRSIGSAGRQSFEAHCSWPAAWRDLDAIVASWLGPAGEILESDRLAPAM